jgi:amino acid permease
LGQAYDYINYYWINIYKTDDPKTWLNLFDISTGFDKNFFFFRTFASLLFGLNYHVGLISITSTLKKNDLNRKVKIMRRSMIHYSLIFVLFGTIGYICVPINTPDLIILRNKIYKSDWLIDIGRVFLGISYIMKLPVMMQAFLPSINSLIFDDPEYSK